MSHEILANVKKDEALALISGGGWSHPTTAVKVFVKKKNPRSVVFEHEGKEHKVGLDGRGVGFQQWVEPWDDAREAQRVKDGKLFLVQKQLKNLCLPVYSNIHEIRAEDAVRSPVLLAELEALRKHFEDRTRELVEQIKASRI